MAKTNKYYLKTKDNFTDQELEELPLMALLLETMARGGKLREFITSIPLSMLEIISSEYEEEEEKNGGFIVCDGGERWEVSGDLIVVSIKLRCLELNTTVLKFKSEDVSNDEIAKDLSILKGLLMSQCFLLQGLLGTFEVTEGWKLRSGMAKVSATPEIIEKGMRLFTS